MPKSLAAGTALALLVVAAMPAQAQPNGEIQQNPAGEPGPAQTRSHTQTGGAGDDDSTAPLTPRRAEADQTAPDGKMGDPDGPGWISGNWRFIPEVSVTGMYDDNVFATPGNEIGSFVTIVSPKMRAVSQWDRHSLDLSMGAHIGRYATQSTEDYADWFFAAEGTLDLADNSKLFGGLDYDHSHEDRSSPDDVNGTKPTVFNQTSLFAGLDHDFGNTYIRPGITFKRMDFNDVPGTLGTINNDDRDRDMFSLGFRAGLRPDGRDDLEVFAQGQLDKRKYDDAVDDNGLNRDSSGHSGAVGLAYTPGKELETEFLLGYMHQNYEDAAFGNNGALDYGARVKWRPDARWYLRGFADRTIQETTINGSSGYLYSTIGGEAVYRLNNRWALFAPASFSNAEYADVNRKDEILRLGGGAIYRITPFVSAELGYQFVNRDSNTAGNGYDNNVAFVSLTTRDLTQPVFEGGTSFGKSAFDGIYVGAMGGVVTTGSVMTGPRNFAGPNPQNYYEGPMMDMDGLGGFYTGFGRVLDNNIYLGAELNVSKGGPEWTLVSAPNGRIERVERESAWGLSAIGGYALDDDAMIYGRAGYERATYDGLLIYDTRSRTTVQSDNQRGLRFGGGVDVNLGDNWHLRYDYSHVNYNDFPLFWATPGRPNRHDVIDPSEDLFMLGLDYRFNGDNDGPVRDRDGSEFTFGGFYGGAMAEWGQLLSHIGGPRDDGAFFQNVEYGGNGLAGALVAGYGHQFANDWFLAAEIEGSLGGGDWSIKEPGTPGNPNGRFQKTSEQESYGAALRGGYVVNDRVLVFGRAGLVRTGFDTQVHYNTAPRLIATDSQTETGYSLGGGVEVGMRGPWHMRADYNFTNYGSYNVLWEDGPNPGRTDESHNSETSLRLGLVYRFGKAAE